MEKLWPRRCKAGVGGTISKRSTRKDPFGYGNIGITAASGLKKILSRLNHTGRFTAEPFLTKKA